MLKPNELIEHLAFHVSNEYHCIRMKNATFFNSDNKLVVAFIYDEKIEGNLKKLKKRLEEEFKKLTENHLKNDINIAFDYEKSYVDATVLKLAVGAFLKENFPVFCVGMEDEDISVNGAGEEFTVNIYLSPQSAEYIEKHMRYKNFIANLSEEYFATFNFFINKKDVKQDVNDFDVIEQYMRDNSPTVSRIDKVMKVSAIEYYFGVPIKERPIKIEFLKNSPDEQIIAGTMSNLTKREFTKKHGENAGEQSTYYTFMLDDGKSNVNCVYFPNQKNLARFEKLTDGTTVALIGIHHERNGRISFRVAGVSFCQL